MAEALIHLTMKILEEMGLNEVRIRSGEGNGTPLQYSCLGNPMDRGLWPTRATMVGYTVRGVAKGSDVTL